MFVGFFCSFFILGCMLNVVFYNQEGFVYFFNCIGFFFYCSVDSGDVYWAVFEFMDNGGKDFVIYFIQAVFVYIEGGQAIFGDFVVDGIIFFNLCEILDMM